MPYFNYLYSNCMEIPLDIGCCKYPHTSELSAAWENNREGLLSFIEATHWGVKGNFHLVIYTLLILTTGRVKLSVAILGEEKCMYLVSLHGSISSIWHIGLFCPSHFNCY